MAEKMCDINPHVVKVIKITPKLEKQYDIYPDYFSMRGGATRPIPRIRLKCPICGRKVLSSISIDHDADFIFHTLPPHKVKGWWKKKKKMKREKLHSRQV